MKAVSIVTAGGVTGVLTAAAISSTAFAWHPKGVITKSVMNQTAGTALSDANDAASAVSAKPGDVLKYVIEVRNDGSASDMNDMYYTKLTDKLPAGVQLVSDPSKTDITEDLGTIKAGAKVTKEYLVKVVSTKDGDLIENEACFTGDSQVKDNPQKGCDSADVKVTVPPKQETPAPTQPAPTQPTPAAAQPTKALPNTGASEFLAPVAALTSGAAAYAGRLISLKRRQQ